MKKLTLNETWEQCLLMWRWIVRQPCPRDIDGLKIKYLEKIGIEDGGLDNNCFFCEYDKSRSPGGRADCSRCPADKVEKGFHCGNTYNDYKNEPAAFLRKITELNKIRLARRIKWNTKNANILMTRKL